MNPSYFKAERLRLALTSLIAALALFTALPVAASAAVVDNPVPDLITRWEPCEPNAGVTVIVDFQDLGDHDVQVGCAEGEQPSGLAALINAGFGPTGTKQYGLGFVCRIDELPTSEEQSCNATPPGTEYWSYWHGKPGGQWSYSGTGAGGYKPKLGSVEGWAFSRRLVPGSPAFRIPPQDGGGATLAMPGPNPSSSAQLRPAQAWLARQLEALAPVGSTPAYTAIEFNPMLAFSAALARSDHALNAARFGGVRAYLEDPLAASIFTTSEENLAQPRIEVLPEYAIALAELRGGQPLLSDASNLRARLIGAIDPATGGVKNLKQIKQDAFYIGPVIEALARTGGLPAEAQPAIAKLLDRRKADGNFEVQTIHNLGTMRALVAARAEGVEGLDAAVDGLADWVASLQESDGGIRQRDNVAVNHNPNFASTAAGAAILGLAGRSEAAREAAFWISPLQITAELAGGETGAEDEGPASADVGAFAKSIDALREAVLFGTSTATGIVDSTPQALDALDAAGPYGPYHATLDQSSLRFDEQASGSSGPPQAVTLTNHDVRPLTIAAAGLAGDNAADFQLEADDCLGEALQAGESCELSARFTPGATGFRQAVARLDLGEGGQVVDLALEGVAVAAEPPPGPLDEVAGRPGDSNAAGVDPTPTRSIGPDSIRAAKRTRMLGSRRTGAIATIVCPGAGPCRITVPRRVPVAIGGRTYRLAVLAPKRIAAGGRANLWVRLSHAAHRRLAGGRAAVSVRVRIASQGATASRTVRVAIGR